VKEELFFRRLF